MEIVMSANKLIVRQEPVQQVYHQYLDNKFIVNRRYQRKLVWDKLDKQKLIDTLINGYPIPLFLLAKAKISGNESFEIIDGMQRLNAIFSFIEQDFKIEGGYFNLKTMVESQERMDAGLYQKEPILDIEVCRKIASYTLAISEFSAAKVEYIDDVFRRINSNGKYLSPQEVRTAGVLTPFSQIVRVIASKIRGDSTTTDIFPLSKMPSISLTDDNDDGIKIDRTYWVKNGIYAKQQVKESRDEEIIADMIAYILLGKDARSASEVLDDYYGIHRYEAGESRRKQLETALATQGPELIAERFMAVHSAIASIFDGKNATFSTHVYNTKTSSTPRYYQCIFLAVYDLMINNSLSIASPSALLSKLSGIGVKLSITPGGKWNGSERYTNVTITASLIKDAFVNSQNKDPALSNWLTQLQNIISQSKIEQPCYDFKQGLMKLDGKNKIDEPALKSILQTASAMANQGPGCIGYILIGVSDKVATAERHKKLSSSAYAIEGDFFITGVDFEADRISGSLDGYQQLIVQRIKESSLDKDLSMQILNDLRIVRIHGKHCIIIKIKDIGKANTYADSFFTRNGANTEEVKGGGIVHIVNRFN